ncbi:T9SS type A sorting domain-containing protein [Aquimarina celericrescens]|uniref:T9SS type A sorting domain-containing protein n=2 Tax=Aquimarina celericrescens TaxID=1964542 RepID=A0ABW5AVA2_9FLAO|nr:VCBS repeat-containing protein [Aquimarina celericrescens]
MKKLLCICFLLTLGNQLIFSQADYISWEFRGGNLLNNPDGTSTGPGPEPAGLFNTKIPTTNGRLPSAILADLDNDNDLDFISGSQEGSVHYFENTGTPTAPHWVLASIPTLDTIWIARDLTVRNQNRPQLADIDGDGDLDLFIGTDYDYEEDRNNDILFYRNISIEANSPIFEYVPAGLPGLNNQEIGEFPGLGFVDLDNDTDLDLVALGSDKLTYYKNIGTRTDPNFERQSEADSPWDDANAFNNMDAPIPVFEDFDKDGDYDMFFMVDDPGLVRWIENVGTVTTPNFVSPQKVFNGELTLGEIGSFGTIDFGDVDGDGLKDAILASFNVPRFAWFRQVPVCIAPTITEVAATPVLCEGETSTITISGNLNIASTWSIYTDSCGGTLLGTTSTNTSAFEVTPSAPSTTYYIRGEDGNITCIDETTAICTTITIPVNALDDSSFNYNKVIHCTNDSNPTPIITGLAGGTFSADTGLNIDPNSGTIDIASSTTGSYTVTYTTAGTCPDSSEVTVEIVALDDPSFRYSQALYCSNEANPSPIITGTPGGTFSADIGLNIDPNSGTIDIAGSTTGSYTVTYTTAGTCPDSSEVTVEIVALDDPSFGYSQAVYCSNEANPSPIITGTPGGTFSADIGLNIDPNSGTIDIASSTAGIYTIAYTTAGTCPNSSEVTLEISELDDPSFGYSQAVYCSNEANPSPIITGTPGGTFSADTGLNIDPNSGTIDIAGSTAGSYTVTYTTTGICSDSSNFEVDISALDDASFNYEATTYCANDSNPTPSITGLIEGVFSSTAGLSIDPSSGSIDIASSTPGIYTVTYTTSGTCPNSNTVDVTINELPDVIVTNNSPTLTSTTLANASYQWINCDTNEPVSGETNASFTATENGLFAVEVTQNGCSIRSSCFAIQNLNPDDVDTINSFKTYPNPTRSSINLTLSTVNKITLYNYYGRKVFETSETSFDISSLTSGIYFMEVETNEGRTIKKIVRQ